MAEKQGISLSSIDDFPEDVSLRLAELWITTAEELVAAVVRENGPQGLSEFLEVSLEDLNNIVAIAQAALPPALSFAPDDIVSYGLGAMDEPEGDDLELSLGAVAFAPLPANVDLSSHMPPVRSQGLRGTCVAFSCTAVREFLLGASSTTGDLSEQYLYWDCKQRDNYSGPGTWIKYGMAALEDDGICSEDVWPYNPNPISGNEGQGPPPSIAETDAAARRISNSNNLKPRVLQILRQNLSEGKPIAFAVPVYTYWFTQPVRTTGDIRLPLSTDNLEGGHAMCMVGYEDDPDIPGGGFFIVRNSWGTGWASNSPLRAGYARIPYGYIEKYGKSAFVATLDPVPEEEKKGFLSWLLDFLRKLFS